ncbi:MAG: peptide deformylase [Pseudomonadota bacterium]
MIRQILIHPDPRLKKSCETVSVVDDSIRALMDDMLETMYEAPGIGLAAPQIGVLQRVVVVDCTRRDEGETPEPLCMANPEVVAASEELREYEEGCLSIPEIYAPISRPDTVTIRYIDRDGTTTERAFDGIWSTCIQHEIDHLNGRLFIDYLGPMRRRMITEKMKKLKRERARAEG